MLPVTKSFVDLVEQYRGTGSASTAVLGVCSRITRKTCILSQYSLNFEVRKVNRSLTLPIRARKPGKILWDSGVIFFRSVLVYHFKINSGIIIILNYTAVFRNHISIFVKSFSEY